MPCILGEFETLLLLTFLTKIIQNFSSIYIVRCNNHLHWSAYIIIASNNSLFGITSALNRSLFLSAVAGSLWRSHLDLQV